MADYFQLTIKINPEISEIVSNICFENFDCEGVVLAEENYKDDLVLVSTTEDTLKAFLTSIIGVNFSEVLSENRKILISRGFSEDDLGSWDFEITKIENEDWSKKWKENWTVTHVSDKISVAPNWIEHSPKADEIVIKIDPGSAFGTGIHPTTQLCMTAMEKYLKINDKIADIGTGSGILAITAIKLGAVSAFAIDNDELVIDVAKENAIINKVQSQCHFECNTADKLIDKYDFICANIIHYTIAEIMGDLKALLKDGAIIVLSGILDEKKQIVTDAIEKHGMKLIDEISQDIWVGLVVKN